MKRRGVRVLEFITAAACAAMLGLASLPAAEEPAAPELLGPAGPDRILKISPEWKAMYDAYPADETIVAGIREAVARAGGELRIEVIFGSWCSDSLEQVPPFLKILDQIGKDGLPATYVGVHQSREDRDERITLMKIEAIPTFIVYRKDAEIGRIVETPKATIEADLLEILSRPSKP